MTRIPKWLLTPIVAFAIVFGIASPAAAVTTEQKLSQLSAFTQNSTASYDSWNSARQNQGAWADYGFNWTTDYCSDSPDNPLGFNFSTACYRHDFGYRNYKEMGQFPANKDRIDSYFYGDMKRKCATYNWAVRPACYSLAWTYYQAVKAFGSVIVTDDDLQRAANLLPANSEELY